MIKNCKNLGNDFSKIYNETINIFLNRDNNVNGIDIEKIEYIINYYKKVVNYVNLGFVDPNIIMGYYYTNVITKESFIYFSETIVDQLSSIVTNKSLKFDSEKVYQAFCTFSNSLILNIE